MTLLRCSGGAAGPAVCARSGAGGVAGGVGGPAPSGPPALFGSDTPRLPVGIRRSLGGAKPRRECPNAVVCHPVGTSLRVWRLVGAAARCTTGPKGSRSDEGRLYGAPLLSGAPSAADGASASP